jgi:hypothetical protein
MIDDYQNALNFTYSGGLLQQVSDATGSGRYFEYLLPCRWQNQFGCRSHRQNSGM